MAYLDKRFENLSKKPLSYFEIFDIFQLPHDREALAVYGDKDVENLVHHFSEVLTDEDIASIPDEWSDLKIWMGAHRGRNNLLDLYSDLVRESPEHLSNILVLVQLLLTLSPSTASCKRGFSCMNRVKYSQRTCLQNGVLKDLIQLFADGCEVNEYSADKALEYWYFSAKGIRHLDHKTPERKLEIRAKKRNHRKSVKWILHHHYQKKIHLKKRIISFMRTKEESRRIPQDHFFIFSMICIFSITRFSCKQKHFIEIKRICVE